MAKQHAGKPQHRTDIASEEIKTESPSPAKDINVKPEAVIPEASNVKKSPVPTRPKKQTVSTTKSGSLLPTAYKLEHLKAAVAAAGNAEKLLVILQHVEEAGGKLEVTESIEAYRVLKTVLED